MQPFSVQIAQDALDDMARRLRETRWLEPPLAEEPGYGVTLGTARALVRAALESFDWRALEKRINRQPQILAEVDGLALHAIHRPSPRADAMPLLLIHGWPTSFLEFLDICDALAEPEGDAPAFHVVVPSLPGYGFSQTRPGTSPRRIATLFAELMEQLGYERYLVQGGNWGSTIGTEMAREHPHRLIGLHLNSLNGSAPPQPVTLSEQEQAMAQAYAGLLSAPHFNLSVRAPFSLAHALNDSPAGTLAWLGQWLSEWADADLEGNPGLETDWIVGTGALYWLTGTTGSAAMLYAEAVRDPVPERYVTVPTAISHFARELVMIPRPWAEHHYNITRWTDIASGGHYPAIEVPDLFLEEVRAFATALCQTDEAG